MKAIFVSLTIALLSSTTLFANNLESLEAPILEEIIIQKYHPTLSGSDCLTIEEIIATIEDQLKNKDHGSWEFLSCKAVRETYETKMKNGICRSSVVAECSFLKRD